MSTRFHIRKLLGIGALTALTVCGDSTSPREALVGTYTLASIDGTALPVTYSPGLRILSSSLTLRADAHFDRAVTSADANGAQSTGTQSGTWSVSGGRVAFTQSDGTFLFDGPVVQSGFDLGLPRVWNYRR